MSTTAAQSSDPEARNAVPRALRAGLSRGWIEFKQTVVFPQELLGTVLSAAVLVIILVFLRGHTFGGTAVSLGTAALPSSLGMMVAFNGLMSAAGVLLVEREDGTLLRAKATPHGMLGYLVGKVIQVSGGVLLFVLTVLVPGLFLFDGLAFGDPGSWLSLLGVIVVGLFATLPIGAVIGSLFTSPRSQGVMMLPLLGLVGISGIFYPITHFPEWLQWIAQVFPMYWMGLGMRAAMLPEQAVAIEIGASWRQLEMFGVLGVWVALGLVVAPIVLRRMARRESGSAVAERRQQAMQRVG